MGRHLLVRWVIGFRQNTADDRTDVRASSRASSAQRPEVCRPSEGRQSSVGAVIAKSTDGPAGARTTNEQAREPKSGSSGARMDAGRQLRSHVEYDQVL